MKKVKWIIDKGMFEEYEDRLVAAIKNSGNEVIFYDDLKHDKIEDFLKTKFNSDEDILIFHGSLQHGRGVLRTSYYPGIYLTLENYECYKYYGYFGYLLLNYDYLMMGLNDVLRQKDFIFDTFGTDKIFIRPSNGYKSFPGQILPKENFEFELDVLKKSYGGLDLDQIVLVSPIQEIEEEYRFIVVDGKVVSGSLYMDKNNRKSWSAYYDRLCEDKKAFEFAEELVKLYQPDKAYTLDVCKTPSGEYKMLEINSFCCGSMYGNDYDKVVNAINELCLQDFNEIYS